jgi:hypothetical protein
LQHHNHIGLVVGIQIFYTFQVLYDEYEYYEEYYYQFIMDRTPPTWAEQMAHMVRIPSGPPEIVDISSVYELMIAAPTNEAAAAA